VRKSGKPEDDVRKLIQKIINIRQNSEIAAIDLVELDEMMASFYGHIEKENT
jgi:S-adenosylmethionine synthetase